MFYKRVSQKPLKDKGRGRVFNVLNLNMAKEAGPEARFPCSGSLKLDQSQPNPTGGPLPVGVSHSFCSSPPKTPLFLFSAYMGSRAPRIVVLPPFTQRATSFLRSKLAGVGEGGGCRSCDLTLWASPARVPRRAACKAAWEQFPFCSAFQHAGLPSLLSVLWLLGDPCWSLGGVTASSNFGLPHSHPSHQTVTATFQDSIGLSLVAIASY